jgi:PAS domain S-box-containing protein
MTQDYGFLNLLINLLHIAGICLVGFLAFKARRVTSEVRHMIERIESVIAPKVGIENHLLMCAQVVEEDPDGLCVVNGDGEIVLVNQAMENISGYHRSELVGDKVEKMVPQIYRGVHAEIHRPGFMFSASTRPMRGVVLQHKRGHERPVDVMLSHYRDASGEYAIAKVRVLNSVQHESGDTHRTIQ